MKFLKILLILISSMSLFANDGLLVLKVDGVTSEEIELGFIYPGQVETKIIKFTNTNNTQAVSSLAMSLSSNKYSFSGGTYPGTGGNCSSELLAQQECSVVIEYSSEIAGDLDSDLLLAYSLTTATLGSSHQYKVVLDGLVQGTGGGSSVACPALKPVITDINPGEVGITNLSEVTITGANLTDATNIRSMGLSIGKVTYVSPRQVKLALSSSLTIGDYDLNISNECGQTTVAKGIKIRQNPWLDLRTENAVSNLDSEYVSGRFDLSNFNPNYGFKVQHNYSQGWNSFIKFNATCNTIDKNFEMIIYRENTNNDFMISLWNKNSNAQTYNSYNANQHQYWGFWNRSSQLYGWWGSEGTWAAQQINYGDRPTYIQGKYYKYVFESAGQAGNQLTVKEVDSNFNDVFGGFSYSATSTKISTSATEVCLAITPHSSGDLGFYLTAVRSY